jgi:hypothetical protein
MPYRCCCPSATTMNPFQGQIQDFKLGGGALKKIEPEWREAQILFGYFV